MAVKIRLRRMGSKNAAFYRVIVQDARRAPTGRFIETLGWYDPKQDGINFSLNLDRADYWLGNGAQPSDTAASLIKKARTLPVGQAVAGEVTEEEIPVAAIEAEETTEDAVAETDVPADVSGEASAETEEESETKEPVAEEAAADVAEEPVDVSGEASAETEEESDTKEPVAEEVAEAPADVSGEASAETDKEKA